MEVPLEADLAKKAGAFFLFSFQSRNTVSWREVLPVSLLPSISGFRGYIPDEDSQETEESFSLCSFYLYGRGSPPGTADRILGLHRTNREIVTWAEIKSQMLGTAGWLSPLSVWLQFRSWSSGLSVRALHWALYWQLRAWSLLGILCLLLSLPLPGSCSASLFLSIINKLKKRKEPDAQPTEPPRCPKTIF